MDATSHATSADARIATASRRSGFVRAGVATPLGAAMPPSTHPRQGSLFLVFPEQQAAAGAREGGRARAVHFCEVGTGSAQHRGVNRLVDGGVNAVHRPTRVGHGGRGRAPRSHLFGIKRSGSCMNIPATKAMMPQMPIVPPKAHSPPALRAPPRMTKAHPSPMTRRRRLVIRAPRGLRPSPRPRGSCSLRAWRTGRCEPHRRARRGRRAERHRSPPPRSRGRAPATRRSRRALD